MSISSYWSIEKKTKSVKITYEESKTELKKILKEAVSHRLKADVPLGLFLSGGIDSSLISAMAKEVKSDVKTYSIKFLEKKFDESDDSKKIAKYLGTNHHTFVCDLEKGKELIETFYKYYDEPFADISALPSMLLSSEVKKDVTVALTGDGADEFFIGYSRYKWMNQLKEIYKLPYWLRKSVGFIGGKLPIYKLQMLSKGIIFKSLDSLYFGLITTFKTDYIRLKPNYDFKKISKKYFKNNDLLKACSLFDMQVYLNSDINTKVDRASMAYSLETRSPFMDHKVIEFALKIPTNHKFKNNKTKYILKDILEDYMPKDLFDRPKKGFGVPLESWLKKDLKPLVLDCYDSFKKRDFKYINYQSFDKLLREFYNNKANHSVEIWRMVMFILWLKENEI
jgi:asparagine synthase (glutamine-hydrolysing)